MNNIYAGDDPADGVPDEFQGGLDKPSDNVQPSHNQADKLVVAELLRLRKLYDKYELDHTTDFEGNRIATWSGYKWFRNPISDRIEEITGVRSDQEVAQWLERFTTPDTDTRNTQSRNDGGGSNHA